MPSTFAPSAPAAPTGPDHTMDNYSVTGPGNHITNYSPRQALVNQQGKDAADNERQLGGLIENGFQSHLSKNYPTLATDAGEALDKTGGTLGLSRIPAGTPGINGEKYYPNGGLGAHEGDSEYRARIQGQIKQGYLKNPTFDSPEDNAQHQTLSSSPRGPIGPGINGEPMGGASAPGAGTAQPATWQRPYTPGQTYQDLRTAQENKLSLPASRAFEAKLGGQVAGNNSVQSGANLNNANAGFVSGPRTRASDAGTDTVRAGLPFVPGQAQANIDRTKAQSGALTTDAGARQTTADAAKIKAQQPAEPKQVGVSEADRARIIKEHEETYPPEVKKLLGLSKRAPAANQLGDAAPNPTPAPASPSPASQGGVGTLIPGPGAQPVQQPVQEPGLLDRLKGAFTGGSPLPLGDNSTAWNALSPAISAVNAVRGFANPPTRYQSPPTEALNAAHNAGVMFNPTTGYFEIPGHPEVHYAYNPQKHSLDKVP